MENYNDHPALIKKSGVIILQKDVKWWHKALFRLGFYKTYVYGHASDIDTSKYKSGVELYLDHEVPGALTTKKNKRS